MKPKPPHQVESNRRLHDLEHDADEQRDTTAEGFPIASEAGNNRLREKGEEEERVEDVLDDGNGDNSEDNPKRDDAEPPGQLGKDKNTAGKEGEKHHVRDRIGDNVRWLMLWIPQIGLVDWIHIRVLAWQRLTTNHGRGAGHDDPD